MNYIDKHELKALAIAITAVLAVGLIGGLLEYGINKRTCHDTAELFAAREWKYNANMGCMIKHKDRWVSGEALRGNTINIEKEESK